MIRNMDTGNELTFLRIRQEGLSRLSLILLSFL